VGRWLNDRMKSLKFLILMLVGVTTSAEAFASSIFKCTDANGSVTFAYTPCQATANPRTNANPEPELIEDKMAQLQSVDKRLSTMSRSLRDLRLEKEFALRNAKDDAEKREINQQFERDSAVLLEQITALRQQRGELVDGSINLLSNRTGN